MISGIFLPIRTGLVSVSTSAEVEPTALGDASSLMEVYTALNMSELFPKGNILYAKFISQLYFETTTNNWDANVKVGFKFEGSSSTVWTPKTTKLIATSPGIDKVSIVFDLAPYLADMTDGLLASGIGIWMSNGSGAGAVKIGDDDETTPNAYCGIRIVGE